MRKACVYLLMTCMFLLQNAATCAEAPSAAPSAAKESNATFPVEELFEEARKPDDKFFVEFINMLATLGLVIGLILIVAWFLKRMVNSKLEQANLTSAIKLIERRTLSPKTSVYLIEIHDKTIALAESAEGVTRLTEFPFALSTAEADNTEIAPSFKKLLEGNKSANGLTG